MQDDRVTEEEKRRAMAQYSADGQVDDPTGGNALAEQEYGDAQRKTGAAQPDDDTDANRPAPEGPIGPA